MEEKINARISLAKEIEKLDPKQYQVDGKYLNFNVSNTTISIISVCGVFLLVFAILCWVLASLYIFGAIFFSMGIYILISMSFDKKIDLEDAEIFFKNTFHDSLSKSIRFSEIIDAPYIVEHFVNQTYTGGVIYIDTYSKRKIAIGKSDGKISPSKIVPLFKRLFEIE